MLAELSRHPQVTTLARTTAFGYFPHNMIGLSERITDHIAQPQAHLPRERLWQVRGKEVILATGSVERPLVFPGNDRPGVMLAGAARTYLNRYGALVGQRAVLVTAHDSAYRVAIDLRGAGVEVLAIADVRGTADGFLPRAARDAGIRVLTRATVLGTRGTRIRAVEIAQLDDTGNLQGSSQWLACDLLLMSGGFTPSIHLFSQSRGKVAWDEGTLAFVPATAAERTQSVGACRGLFDLASALEDGASAGLRAAGLVNASAEKPRPLGVECDPAGAGGFIGASAARGREPAKAFVDWQNDVTVRDLTLAVREGFRSIEHVKRYRHGHGH